MAGGSTTPRNLILPVVDKLRAIPAIYGVRLFTVTIVVRSWTGSRPGLGTSSDAAHGVKVDLGVYQTKVRQVTERDAVASGGLWNSQDLRVGPITPPFTGSTADNDAIAILDPPLPAAGTSQEVLFNIQGPGFPTTVLPNGYAGAWFQKIFSDYSRPMRYEFVVRKTAEID